MIAWSVVVGAGFALVLGGLSSVVPRAFSSDHAVLHQAALLWPFFALMQPLGGAVFALDGILIGAGDTAYLAAAMVVAFVVFVPFVLTADTVVGVWAALDLLMLVRLATLGGRFVRRRWALVGAHA
jgi:Na+-driven multidrug efflux pump